MSHGYDVRELFFLDENGEYVSVGFGVFAEEFMEELIRESSRPKMK